MLVSFHKTSPSPSLWSEFALVGLSTLTFTLLLFFSFYYSFVYRADYYSKETTGENQVMLVNG